MKTVSPQIEPAQLVHPLSTVCCTAEAWDLVLVIFNVELVIIGQLLPSCDAAVGNNQDFVLTVDLHDLGHTVRIARVVHVAREATTQGRIDHTVFLETKHVYATILCLVDGLVALGNLVADELPDVLNDHGVPLNVAGGVQSQTLDVRTCQIHVVAPLGLHAPVLRRLGVHKVLGVRGAGVQAAASAATAQRLQRQLERVARM